MNAPTDPKLLERKDALQGMGDSRLRKEDARFIQGKGNYVDDIKMPGMLHMDIVRSPYAHARIKKIDKTAALKVPGVIAVLTADDLKPLKLHWMPTLAGDVAAVLADEKVHFQMQEVAVVIAEDRYAAADGVEAVRGRVRGAAGRDRPVQGARARRTGAARGPGRQDQRRAWPARAPQPHLHLGRRRQGRGRCGLRRRAGGRQAAPVLPARAPLPAGDLRLRGQLRPGARRAHDLHDEPGAARGAHGRLAALGHPREQGAHRQPRHRRRLRQQGRRLPGLRLRDRRVDRARQAGEVDRGPDREHLVHRLRPRLPHGRRDSRPRPTAGSSACAST